ncbi:MAG: hypothetical protein IKA33_00820, partial [Candidatus Methanomethylophilaceae archaeon]|nr:hypothetical protein [Candidatus Methanomethylophilaceae archaeon]
MPDQDPSPSPERWCPDLPGCTFRDIPYICINARNFRDFVCKENTASGVNCFLQGVNLYALKNGAAYII